MRGDVEVAREENSSPPPFVQQRGEIAKNTMNGRVRVTAIDKPVCGNDNQRDLTSDLRDGDATRERAQQRVGLLTKRAHRVLDCVDLRPE